MAEEDALRNFQFKTGKGLFLGFESNDPVKLRILTTDPVVSLDKWGNTRFAFIVYNHTAQKAQILNKGSSFAKEFQKLHQNEDWGSNIKKIDIKIEAEGSGIDTDYTITPLKDAITLTNKQIKECQDIRLEDAIENGQRMSLYDPDKYQPEPGQDKREQPQQDEEESKEDKVVEDVDDEPINLDDIPF